MIELYTWGTPNGRKASIMLEEVGLPYNLHPIDIGKGAQNTPEYIAINPNSKIPAIIDSDGPGGKPVTVFESGAILIYLAEKTGKFWSKEPRARLEALEWLMFQMGGVGPILGQAHHFLRAAKEQIPYAIDRYVKESRRLYGVLDARLAQSAYLAGEYSIADIATYPWIGRHAWHRVDLAEFPNVQRWFNAVGSRPAVERGMAVPFLN
jgi:GST-like protein